MFLAHTPKTWSHYCFSSPKLAAKRYVHYWQKRLEIFGPDRAFRPLTLEQALSEDSVALSIGVIQLTGTKDPSGRSIVFIDPSKQDRTKYTRESMCRTLWYMLHAALENEDSQRKGVVVIGYPHHVKFSQVDRALMKLQGESVRACIPVRLSGFHLCHPPVFFAIIYPIIKLMLGERLRKRISVHYGSEEKVLHQLEKYGLAKDAVPSDLGGDVVLDVQSWLDKRRAAKL
jgi:hypothetical protein